MEGGACLWWQTGSGCSLCFVTRLIIAEEGARRWPTRLIRLLALHIVLIRGYNRVKGWEKGRRGEGTLFFFALLRVRVSERKTQKKTAPTKRNCPTQDANRRELFQSVPIRE